VKSLKEKKIEKSTHSVLPGPFFLLSFFSIFPFLLLRVVFWLLQTTASAYSTSAFDNAECKQEHQTTVVFLFTNSTVHIRFCCARSSNSSAVPNHPVISEHHRTHPLFDNAEACAHFRYNSAIPKPPVFFFFFPNINPNNCYFWQVVRASTSQSRQRVTPNGLPGQQQPATPLFDNAEAVLSNTNSASPKPSKQPKEDHEKKKRPPRIIDHSRPKNKKKKHNAAPSPAFRSQLGA